MWKAKVQVLPTEDNEKVRNCLSNFFDNDIIFDGEFYEAAGKSDMAELLKIREKIWSRKILDSVRSQFRRNLQDGRTFCFLNKQAASVGKIGIVDSEKGAPLGAVVLYIDEGLIDWLSPKTTGGVPLLE